MVTVDWVFLGLRIITILGGIIWVSFHPQGHGGHVETNSLVNYYWGFVAYSLLLFFGLVRFPAMTGQLYRISFWLDLTFVLAVIRASEGFQSSFFIAIYLLIALHTAYFASPATGMATSLAGALGYLAALYGQTAGIYWGDLAMRISMMPLVGLSTGILVGQLSKAQAQLRSNAADLERANGRLERKLAQVSSLYEASKALGALLHYDEVLRLIVELASKTLESPVSYLLMCNERGQLYFRSYSGIPDSLAKDACLEPGEGVAGKAFVTQTPAIVEDLQSCPEPWLAEIDREAGLSSLLSVPIINKGKSVGVINVSRREPGCYSQEDLQLLQVISTLAAVAIEKAELFEETQKAAITDGLTQLYNRRYFNQQLQIEVRRGQRYAFPVSLVILDIDHFKKVNDNFGHPAGDQILIEIARRLKGLARHSDIVARYGGEEFAVILPQTSAAGGITFAERIRKAVGERPFRLADGREIPVTVSLGAAEFPTDAQNAEDLLNRADTALYRAKAGGRNRVCPG